MKQKDKNKELLLKDLSARLPYHTIVSTGEEDLELVKVDILNGVVYLFSESFLEFDISEVKPYLRPMSSMTEEERNEYFDFRSQELQRVAFAEVGREEAISEVMDWLLSHHFDIRGLIEKGLALEAPKGMY